MIKPNDRTTDDLSSQLWTQGGHYTIPGNKLALQINFPLIGIEVSAFEEEVGRIESELSNSEIGSSIKDRYGQKFTRVK